MLNPSPAPSVLSADHTAVRRLRLLKDATPPCINLNGLTVLSSTVAEHSLQGSNGFFKGSYSWTEDTSFAVSLSPAHGQPRTKTESTFQSHVLTVQTHRRVVEWYRPGSGGSEYHRWVHIRYRDAFVAWETFSFDTCSGEDETTVGNRSATTLTSILKRLCNDLDVGQLPDLHVEVLSCAKDTALETSHHGVESEDDENDYGRHEDPGPSSHFEVEYAECRQTCEESKLFRLLAGELADDEAVVHNSYGDLGISALWEIAKSEYEC